MESKVCTKCSKLKPITEFYRDSQKKSGYRPSCKDCLDAQKAAYRAANLERYKARDKRYYENNKDKVKATVKKTANKYLQARRKSDPLHKCKLSISCRLRGALTLNQAYTRKSQLFNILGIDNLDLIHHLHSTFEYTYGLPRECINLADVEIDHIIPLSTAQTVDDVRRLNHYTNLQLLFKEDNQAKGTKLTLDFTPNLV